MKQLLVAVLAVLVVASISMAQTNENIAGGTQGLTSGMAGGPHDFTSTRLDSIGGTSLVGPTDFLCGYCHVPHTSKNGVAVPLWSRKSVTTGTSHTGITYGQYTSGTMVSTTADVKASDNYSSFCMSCHDGSQMFASSAYQSKPVPYGTPWVGAQAGWDTIRVPSYMNMSTDGSYGGLSHIHPVNMPYPASDPGLWTPADPQKYAYADATYGEVGRLFAGTVQCSSCHNPHFSEANMTSHNYPMLQGSTDGGKLCVACHKK